MSCLLGDTDDYVFLNRVCELEEQYYRNHEQISDVSASV